MKYPALLIVAAYVLLGCRSNNTTPPDGEKPPVEIGAYKIVKAFPSLPAIDRPVELTAPNDGSNRIFVLSQKGIINVFSNSSSVSSTNVFLDISAKVTSGGEMGLLGLAFDPDYKTNGYFYVNYNRRNPSLETVIARYKVSANNANMADPESGEILLTYAQPFENHNGGKLAFGNDKYLYIAVGDGGSAGDPHGNGQNRKVLLGKILRIDVSKSGANTKYAIPHDNPFKGSTDGTREEIYAYGMRNPWRFSIDSSTGTIWAGDVGQGKIEEIDIIEKGKNYGWNTMEGNECYDSPNCDKSGLTPPIYAYMHGSLGASITGGYVSRDSNLPGLTGRYIYGDYVSGNIWALTSSNKTLVKNDLIGTVPAATLSSFGEDADKHLYILNYADGDIYKFVSAQ